MQRHLKLKKVMISLTGNNSLPVSLSHSHWCWRIGIAREMQKAWRVGNETDEFRSQMSSCDSARMRPGKRNVKPTKRTEQNTGPGEDLTKLYHVCIMLLRFFPQEHDVAKIRALLPLNLGPYVICHLLYLHSFSSPARRLKLWKKSCWRRCKLSYYYRWSQHCRIHHHVSTIRILCEKNLL